LRRQNGKDARMIHVLDELAVRPGVLAEVRARVRDVYEPMVAPLGMRLAQSWIAPAVELLDGPTDLLLLWECADTAAYWRAKNTAARDPAAAAFWASVEPLLAGRSRRIMVDPDDESVLR
jgi:hypothetical protein